MMKRWDKAQSKEVERPDIDAFLEEVSAVCKRHRFSISHEDDQGGFLVEKYDESNIEWLLDASANDG